MGPEDADRGPWLASSEEDDHEARDDRDEESPDECCCDPGKDHEASAPRSRRGCWDDPTGRCWCRRYGGVRTWWHRLGRWWVAAWLRRVVHDFLPGPMLRHGLTLGEEAAGKR